MKKWILIEFLGALLIIASGCKNTKKEAKVDAEVPVDMYSIVEDSTSVSFTAYKTTDKLPVGGKFTKVNLKNTSSSDSKIKTMDGLEFSIPVSSLFTNDATGTRDPKIIEFFFGAMVNTELISGTFSLDGENKCSVNLSLNGVSAVLPMDYEITNDNHINFTGVLQLEKWNAMDAVASLNKACKILHTGPDGVSKTWSEVAIEASILLDKN